MSLTRPSPFVLEMNHISKRFGATRALEDVSFTLRRGEVHALLGENGAGKSTLVKILSGAIKPDQGQIVLNQLPYAPSGPLEGRNKGISMIYQELNLAPHLTVEENIMLGKEVRVRGFIKRKEMQKRVKEAMDFLHHPEISLKIPVKYLSVGARQIVEICRAILDEAKILIMDEPTSSLSQEDTERLFQIINKLKAEGVSIIYISHFLEEVKAVADCFTVLRDGRNVGSGKMEGVSLEEMIQMMVGQKIKDLFTRSEHARGEVLLSLNMLRGKNMEEKVSFKLHRSEILGLAGLIGAGRTEVLRAIFGLELIAEGSLQVIKKTVSKGKPWERIRQGLGLLSEDRQTESLALSQSIADNLTLSHFEPYSTLGFLRVKKRRETVRDWMGKLKIKSFGPEQCVASLSGGNQQKVALARLLHQEADILLLDEPTRGIDVMSKSQIYEWMVELASRGKGLVFVSSYFPELLGVCDSIAVFYRSKLVCLRRSIEWDAESLMKASTTGKV